jgi:hypothetical protein
MESHRNEIERASKKLAGRRNAKLTPWSRGLLEKLTVSQLIKKFPAFYGTRRFITAFTRARHLSLSWASSIQSMSPAHVFKIPFNISLPSTPRSPTWSPSLRSRYQNPLCTYRFLHTCYMPRPSHSSRFNYSNNIWWWVQVFKFLAM